jgi:hypothetical protein
MAEDEGQSKWTGVESGHEWTDPLKSYPPGNKFVNETARISAKQEVMTW